MPPILGIFHADQKHPDPDMISRITHAAKYEMSRQIRSTDHERGWFAAAVQDHQEKVYRSEAFYQSGNFAVGADATLYLRAELLKKLNKNLIDKTVSDTVLILESYMKWGPGCLNYLYGDFAFIIVNIHTGEIFCGRDQLGVRPFYYSMQNNCFVFRSFCFNT